MRVAILIDGSNFLAQLDACDLGFPAIAPLNDWICAGDELVYTRFYSAPQKIQPYVGMFEAFRDANRHVKELDFFQGYRNAAGKEKCIDVALAVDLIYGCAMNHFDRVAIIGGDGDHVYAFKIAKTMRERLRVYLMPGQPDRSLKHGGIAFTHLQVQDFLSRGICEQGRQSQIPATHSAPTGSPDLTQRLVGALARIA